MASYPPPYTPPSGSPYSFDSRQQKRILKLQQRAQQDARRMQERLQRSRFRSMQRSSLLAPVVIVAAGILLLLVRTGHTPATSLTTTFDRWWPITLVFAGIVLSLEWVYDQNTLPAGTQYIRRGTGGGVFLLLLLLAGSGAYLNAMDGEHSMRIHSFGINSDNIAEVFGEKHEREEELNLSVPQGTALSFTNPHGDITITGRSDDDHVHIQINKQVFSTSDADADKQAAQLTPKITSENGIMQLNLPRLNGAEADLSITVPDTDSVTINTSNGDIHVTGIHASVNITQDYGDVELSQLTGSVIAHLNNNGSSFSANEISGNVALKGHTDDVSLSQVTGQVSLEGDFYGDTHLEHISGPIDFRTNRTQFHFGRLDGQLDISPDEDFIANQVVGPTSISTRSRNISLDRVAGDLIVSNSNGTVDVTGAAPLANLRIENRNGSVNLTIPPNSGFNLEAQAQDGEASNDFDLHSTQAGNHNTMNGTVGDGHAHIVLSTTHASVTLHKGDVQAPASIPPVPPPPVPPVRHKQAARISPASPMLSL